MFKEKAVQVVQIGWYRTTNGQLAEVKNAWGTSPHERFAGVVLNTITAFKCEWSSTGAITVPFTDHTSYNLFEFLGTDRPPF